MKNHHDEPDKAGQQLPYLPLFQNAKSPLVKEGLVLRAMN
jgi:hypothetical protein